MPGAPIASVQHLLEVSDELPLPIEQVFAFFSDAANLERITPRSLHFEITSPQPISIRRGTLIDYRLRLLLFPFHWQSEITEWEPPHRFADEQRRGPYASWRHEHTFEATASGTRLLDRVYYQLPFSPLGDLAFPFVRWQLQAIFAFRQKITRQILLSGT